MFYDPMEESERIEAMLNDAERDGMTVRFKDGSWQVVQTVGTWEHVWAECKTEAVALERAAIFEKQREALEALLNEQHERAMARLKK